MNNIKTKGFSYSPLYRDSPFVVNCGQFGFVDDDDRC